MFSSWQIQQPSPIDHDNPQQSQQQQQQHPRPPSSSSFPSSSSSSSPSVDPSRGSSSSSSHQPNAFNTNQYAPPIPSLSYLGGGGAGEQAQSAGTGGEGGGGQLPQWDVGELEKFYSSFQTDTQFDPSATSFSPSGLTPSFSLPSFSQPPYPISNPPSLNPNPYNDDNYENQYYQQQQPQSYEPSPSPYHQQTHPPLPPSNQPQPSQYYSPIPGDFDVPPNTSGFLEPSSYQQQFQQHQRNDQPSASGGFLGQDAFLSSLNSTNAPPTFAFDRNPGQKPQAPQHEPASSSYGGAGGENGRRLGRNRAGEEGDGSMRTGAHRLAESMNLIGVREEGGNEDTEMGEEGELRVPLQVRRYIDSKTRFEDGERTIIIMTPKVGQKSYKAEKRFLCPPPSALLAGPHWFSPLTSSHRHSSSSSPFSNTSSSSHPSSSSSTPNITLTITNEAPPTKQSPPIWISANGNDITSVVSSSSTTSPEIPIYGTTLGKQLFVSEGENLPSSAASGGKRQVRTRVKVVVPGARGVGGGEEGESTPADVEIGTFESREIKVISKPARKKVQGGGGAGAGAKGIDLAMHHGTLISAFQRVRSQTNSTRFLSVSDSASHLKASDGSGLVSPSMWNQKRANSLKPAMFEAGTSHWDAFIIWLVDCRTLRPPPREKAKGTSSFALLDPDWPEPPINALPFDASHLSPICFNHTVVLQCPKSGVISPVLVLRRMDQNTTALGGEPSLNENSTAADVCVPPGERAGDGVSQLQKVAFELYSPTIIPRDPTKAGISGAFLSIFGDRVQTSCPTNARTLFPTANDAPLTSQGESSQPHLSNNNPSNPSQPTGVDSAPPSPPADASGSYLPPTDSSNNGGKVVKRRTSASSLSKPTAAAKGKGKKRTNSTDGGSRPPVGAGPSHSTADAATGNGETARWWIEVPEASVWTIVGVESVRYTFFVPGGGEEDRSAAVGRLDKPVTPLPEVLRYLPPGQKQDNDPHGAGYKAQFISQTAEEMITIYGTAFPKDPKTSFSSYDLLFGSEPSKHVELRCQEVMAAVPPTKARKDAARGIPSRLSLMRKEDGVVIVSRTDYVG